MTQPAETSAGRAARPVPRDAGHRHVHPQATAPQPGPALKTDEPDPLIHALPGGDALSFTRLPDMVG
jgi:hypothetical protein